MTSVSLEEEEADMELEPGVQPAKPRNECPVLLTAAWKRLLWGRKGHLLQWDKDLDFEHLDSTA